MFVEQDHSRRASSMSPPTGLCQRDAGIIVTVVHLADMMLVRFLNCTVPASVSTF